MKIQLKEDSKELNEVVVTGYTTQRKADLTGSVAVVNTKDLKTTADTDPMRALQGHVPGMTITTDGSPQGTGNGSHPWHRLHQLVAGPAVHHRWSTDDDGTQLAEYQRY